MSNFEEFLGAYEAQNRSVLDVREDSNIGATLKLPKERSFRNRSNEFFIEQIEAEPAAPTQQDLAMHEKVTDLERKPYAPPNRQYALMPRKN
ncbi:MAG: hypothetical protein LBF84_03555 [Holosporales bacterium]|nr:hypothetical protein [Holosporales bacterium]